MSIALRIFLMLLIGSLQSIAAHGQSRPRIDMQSHFGTLSLRATKGKGKIVAERYWLYVKPEANHSTPRIIKGIGGGGVDTVAFLPIDEPLTPGQYSLSMVTYHGNQALPSFCVVTWRSVLIESGQTIKITVDGFPGFRESFSDEIDVMVTAADGKPYTAHGEAYCPSRDDDWWFSHYGASFLRVPDRANANWVKERFQEGVKHYDKNMFVAWARNALRSPPTGPHVALPAGGGGSYVGQAYLPGYQADGFQVRVLIDRLRKQYEFGHYSRGAYENELASVAQELRPVYRELARYIAAVRAKISDEIKGFYVIADRLDRAAKQ